MSGRFLIHDVANALNVDVQEVIGFLESKTNCVNLTPYSAISAGVASTAFDTLRWSQSRMSFGEFVLKHSADQARFVNCDYSRETRKPQRTGDERQTATFLSPEEYARRELSQIKRPERGTPFDLECLAKRYSGCTIKPIIASMKWKCRDDFDFQIEVPTRDPINRIVLVAVGETLWEIPAEYVLGRLARENRSLSFIYVLKGTDDSRKSGYGLEARQRSGVFLNIAIYHTDVDRMKFNDFGECEGQDPVERLNETHRLGLPLNLTTSTGYVPKIKKKTSWQYW